MVLENIFLIDIINGTVREILIKYIVNLLGRLEGCAKKLRERK